MNKARFWPISVTLSMALFIVLIVFAGVKMMNQDIILVAEDYYEQELDYQNVIDKILNSQENKKDPFGTYDKEIPAWTLSFPNKDSSALIKGEVSFFCPSDPKRDFSHAFETSESTITVTLPQDHSGPWIVKTDWSEESELYFYEEKNVF